MPEYPFEEAFFLPDARRFRAALKMPLILLGGVNRFETVQRALAEGFAFVALGRALLREPGLVARWREGDRRDSLCDHCNKCIPTIYTGTHCVLVAPGERPGHHDAPSPPNQGEPSLRPCPPAGSGVG
jgi:2,4-dienoyl-CoA reductase-like NADH-dependent reductase (Old Yellow Enzyme family)